MTRFGAAAAALLIALCLAAPAAAAPGVNIRNVDTKEFPKTAVTVSVSGEDQVDEAKLGVAENGTDIPEFEVTPIDQTAEAVDVVLLIDTSGSMQGEPMAQALQAARDFVADLPASIPVGVVAFSDTPRVVSPIVANRPRTLAAINGLTAAGETALYDGVKTASKLFASDAQHNLILLSDGGDTVSQSTLPGAAGGANFRKVTIFAVGLRSTESDEPALRTLASRTKGRFSPVDAADLTRVYQGLAAELGNQFVVSYDSTAEGGTEIDLAVSYAGASDQALVLAPKVEAPPAAPAEPAPVEPETPLLRDTWGLAIILVLIFAAVFLVAAAFLVDRQRTRREEDLERRLGLKPAELEDDADKSGPRELIPESLSQAAQKFAERRGLVERIDARLERAGWSLRAGEYLAATALCAAGGALLGALLLKNVLFALLFAIGTGFLPRAVLGISTSRRVNKLQAQLPDILMVLASSLRAGYSFLQALDSVARDVGGPGAAEFARVITEIRLGRPIDEALDQLAERVDSEDFRWAVMAINIQRDVGGNLAEVLDTVADTMRSRETVRRQISVLSAEGRLSIIILAALPLLVALYMAIVNPTYLGLLFNTRIGVVMVIVSSGLLVMGITWMRRIVRIDV